MSLDCSEYGLSPSVRWNGSKQKSRHSNLFCLPQPSKIVSFHANSNTENNFVIIFSTLYIGAFSQTGEKIQFHFHEKPGSQLLMGNNYVHFGGKKTIIMIIMIWSSCVFIMLIFTCHVRPLLEHNSLK